MSAIDITVHTARVVSSKARASITAGYGLKWNNSNLSARGIAFRLFLTCWLIYGLHFATNTVREIYPALSLGDHFSFNISEYAGLHPDIFEIPGRGAYINNNPGASIIGAVPYTLSRPVIDRVVQRVQSKRNQSTAATPGEYKSIYPLAQEFYRKARERGLDLKLGLAAAVIQAFAMAPLSALSVVVMFYILLSLTGSSRKALLLAILYAFATPVFYRTGQLNQNLLVAHCALFAFAVLWRPWDNQTNPQKPNYLLAGLLCGWAVVLDYSGVVVALVVAVYGLVRRTSLPAQARSQTDIPYFIAGLAICAAVLLGYQWRSFGSPFLPAQRYMPPTELSGYGYHGMDLPHMDLLWDTVLGSRFGLFTSAPLLLLALYIPAWFRKQYRLTGNRETLFIAIFSLLFLLFCASNQYGRLQFNSGVRYIVPVVPFLFLIVSGVLLRMRPLFAILLGTVATYGSWCLAMYRDVEQGLGVFESLKQISLYGLRLPWMTTLQKMGYLSEETSALPVLLLCTAIIWILWKADFNISTPTQPDFNHDPI
jgi:hypothetical protein